MGFPLAYSFIDGAYQEDSDFFKNPNKANPLVDDVFQTKMDMQKRQKLIKMSTAWVDNMEVTYKTQGFS
jgi:hypothetical protein